MSCNQATRSGGEVVPRVTQVVEVQARSGFASLRYGLPTTQAPAGPPAATR